ncbi:MAG: sulfatase/phosphatase domain-containing protein, partial [Planctomycetaceae bacterium]
DISLNWLRTGWDKSRPFFLMHHFKAPHDYFDNAERYESWLRDKEIPEPPTLWERGARFGSIATRGANDELLPHIGTSIGARNPRRSYLGDLPVLYPDEFPPGYDPKNYSDEENTRFAYNAYLRKYLRCVRGVDDNLGRLFQWLQDSGEMDRTVIIYTGDQGFMLGEHDYQDKRWMYEESLRMPLLVRYPPAVPPGLRSDAIIENVDFGPTMLDFAGAEIPADVQGRSFRSIVCGDGEPEEWKQEAYYRYWMHMAHHDNPAHVGIRTKTHKLIYFYGCNYDGGYRTPAGWELYDLVNDPAETVNLANAPEHQPLLQEMKQRLANARTRVGDDGSHFPACEAVLQQSWTDTPATRAEAEKISAQFLQRRLGELQAGKRNPRTWQGP